MLQIVLQISVLSDEGFAKLLAEHFLRMAIGGCDYISVKRLPAATGGR